MLPLTGYTVYRVLWYPDGERLLIMTRKEGSELTPLNEPKVRVYLYLASTDGRCQEVKIEQPGLLSEVCLLDARQHLYLYIIGGELWLGELRGVSKGTACRMFLAAQ